MGYFISRVNDGCAPKLVVAGEYVIDVRVAPVMGYNRLLGGSGEV